MLPFDAYTIYVRVEHLFRVQAAQSIGDRPDQASHLHMI